MYTPASPLLAVEIGNSDIVMGVWEGTHWAHVWRHPTAQYLEAEVTFSSQAASAGLDLAQMGEVIFSSVVPGISPALLAVVRQLTARTPIVMGADLYLYLKLGIDNPYEIGADLVANAIAGYTRSQQACIVVDFGTALTFTALGATGRILGVAIAPGLRTAMHALFHNTAQLPIVPLELPASPIGKNTAHAMQAGILLGYVGLVRELVTRIKSEIPGPCRVLLTGGLSAILAPELAGLYDERDPHLTLDGLRLIAEKYRQKIA
ncbi:MAG: type III pantothenate kinase [Bacteroidia bacterium]|nr:type III pantothenate kinase [Bacteroidia bacterium]